MGATGESVRRVTDFGMDPCWSPDGRKLAFATEAVDEPYSRTLVSALWTLQQPDVRLGAHRRAAARPPD